MTEGAIFTQCIYDVDNHYVDLTLNPTPDSLAFTLTMSDASSDKEYDCEIKMHLTRVDLRTVIDHLTNILNKQK